MRGVGPPAQCAKACNDEPLSPMPAISFDEEYDVESNVDEVTCNTMAFLEGIQSRLAGTVVAAVSNQLKTLTADLQQVADEALGSSSAPHISALALASAIEASLAPTFDSLENEASQLTQEMSMSIKPSHAMSHAPSSELAASVLGELLPQLKGAVTATIEDVMTPRLSCLDDLESQCPVLLGRHIQANADPKVQNDDIKSSCANTKSRVTIDELASDSPSQKRRSMTLLSLPLSVCDPESVSSCELTKRHSDITRNRQPERAFVVNFRRLVMVQKILSLIHLFIKSTAIATLTLVSSAYWTDLLFSVTFVSLVLGLYAVHEMRHDGMDIEDYRSLGGLLEDDNGSYEGPHGEYHEIQNPNRLLKALTLSKSRNRRRRSFATVIAAVLLLVISWMNIIWCWSDPKGHGAHGLWLGLFNADDIAVMATQMLIGTATLLFHAAFEWLYWRETQCVMPWDDFHDRPWDPRPSSGNGVPRSHSWFGLPSMWFTSQAVYDDLRLWITLATSQVPVTHVATKIFPEEMALFALEPDKACDLRRTLRHAKLFSLADWEYQSRKISQRATSRHGSCLCLRSLEPGEAPEELRVELTFYDSATGQFLEPHHKEYNSGVTRLFSHAPVVVTPKSITPKSIHHARSPSVESVQAFSLRETTGNSHCSIFL